MPIQVTTDLPDEDQPSLGNGVEDEVAVDREDAVSNYGSVRIQIRETGASSWDSSAAGFAEFIGDHDTLTMEFVGREDGEEYEVRARTETEHRTGAWTDPVNIVTKFPGVTNLQVTASGQTSVDLEGEDNADNESGFRIHRQREYDPGWGPWREVGDLAANSGTGTITPTDDTASPGNTYRYRVEAYTSHASAVSNETDSVVTESSGYPRTQTGSQGWHVEVDHPVGVTLTPSIVADGVEWQPILKDLPRVELPVPKNEKWEGDALDGADMRVWKDGQRLPIDTMRTTTREESRDILHGVGATTLDQHIEAVQFDERDAHEAARAVIEDELDLSANVDDPATNTRSGVRMQSAEFANEFEDVLDDPGHPFPDDEPVELWDTNVRPQQTGWFVEAEDTESDAGTYFADIEGDDGAWSGNQTLQLQTSGEEIEFTFNTDHVIPEGECVLDMIYANPDKNPGLDVYVTPSGGGEEQVESLPEDSLLSHDDKFDLHAFDYTLNPDSDLQTGAHTVRFEVTSDAPEDNGLYMDFFFPHDDRYPYAEDLTPEDDVVEGWWQYPTIDLVFEPVSSVEQVTGGRATTSVSDTSEDQAVAVRNGTNDWVEAQNSEEVVVEAFTSGEQSIQFRATVGGRDTGSSSGDYRAAPQELEEFTLYATLEDVPVLLDKYYSGSGVSVLNRIADVGPFIWEARWDAADGVVVEWTMPGQRTTDRDPSFVDYSGRRTVEGSYQRIIVVGESKTVEDERWQQDDYDVYRGLDEQHIQPDSETVFDPNNPDTTFERGVDYGMDWHEGSIELLDGGAMETNTEYAIDYARKVHGEYALPDEDDPRTREVQIPEASTEREADQFARGLVAELQDPLEEVQVSFADVDPGWSLVEALASPGLPFEGPLEVRELPQGAGETTGRLGSRQSVSEAVDELRNRIEAVARQL